MHPSLLRRHGGCGVSLYLAPYCTTEGPYGVTTITRPLHPWISRSDHPQIPRPKMASDPGTRSGPDPDTIWGHILGPIMEQILVLILVPILYAIYTYRIPGAYTPQYVKTIGTGCMCASVGALCGVYYVPQIGHQMGTPFGVISDPRMDPRSGPRMVPGSGPHLDHRSDTPDVPWVLGCT